MSICFNNLNGIMDHNHLEDYLKSIITGRQLREIGENDEREFILDYDTAAALYDVFGSDIDALGSENEVRQEVKCAHGDEDERMVTLALVNDALHLTCQELYGTYKDKLTPANDDKLLPDIGGDSQKGQER